MQLRQQDDSLATEQGEKTVRQLTKVRDQGLLLLDQVTALCLSTWDSAEIKAVLSRQGSEIDHQQSTMDAQHQVLKSIAGASQAPLLRASARLMHLGKRERPEDGTLSQGGRESLSQGSAFNTFAVERVKAAREHVEKASKPASGTTMSDGDIEQFLLLYRWKSVGKIFQVETLFPSKPENSTVRWSALKEFTREQMKQLMAHQSMDVLVVVAGEDMDAFHKHALQLCSKVECGRVDVLIQLKDAQPILPNLGPRRADKIPWPVRSVSAFSRAFKMSDGPCKDFAVVLSSQKERQAKVQPRFGPAICLMDLGESIGLRPITLRHPAENEYVVQIGYRIIPQVLKTMGKKGSEYATTQGRTKGQSRPVMHTMQPDDLEFMIHSLADTQWFAVSTAQAHSGRAFLDCHLVAQCFLVGPHEDEIAPKLWSIIYKTTAAALTSGFTYLQTQVLNAYKIRLGVATENAAEMWLSMVLPELEMTGIQVKNERAQQRLGDGDALSDGSAGSASSMAEGADEIIMYDVPIWTMEREVRELVESASAENTPELERVRRAPFTPGDATLVAWRIRGQHLQQLAGCILRDSTTGDNIYVMSGKQYAAARQRHRDGAKKSQKKKSTSELASEPVDKVSRWKTYAAAPRSGGKEGDKGNGGNW